MKNPMVKAIVIGTISATAATYIYNKFIKPKVITA